MKTRRGAFSAEGSASHLARTNNVQLGGTHLLPRASSTTRETHIWTPPGCQRESSRDAGSESDARIYSACSWRHGASPGHHEHLRAAGQSSPRGLSQPAFSLGHHRRRSDRSVAPKTVV